MNSDIPYNGTAPDDLSVEDGLLAMIGGVEDMTRLLPGCMVSCNSSQMDACEEVAQEVRRQAKSLTRKMVASIMAGESPRSLVRFPLRLERIADELDSVLTCCRIKARDRIEFSLKAHSEMDQVFAIILDTLINFADVISAPNSLILRHILSQGDKVSKRLQEARLGHWFRLENGECTPESGSLFLDVLDSLKSSNEYIHKMAADLLAVTGANDNPLWPHGERSQESAPPAAGDPSAPDPPEEEGSA